MRLGKLFTAIVLVAGPIFGMPSARADVLYAVAPNLSGDQNGTCVYNTNCGQRITGDTFAAEEFSLNGTSTIDSFNYNSIVFGDVYGISVNYIILTDSENVLQSDTASLSHTPGPTGPLSSTTNYAFNVTPISLNAGDYLIAFQEITPNTEDYLSLGVASDGAFESDDGGGSFTAGLYSTSGFRFPSVALTVNGTATTSVSEPNSLPVLASGFFALCAFCYRRKARGELT